MKQMIELIKKLQYKQEQMAEQLAEQTRSLPDITDGRVQSSRIRSSTLISSSTGEQLEWFKWVKSRSRYDS